jgi:hypothetical protein
VTAARRAGAAALAVVLAAGAGAALAGGGDEPGAPVGAPAPLPARSVSPSPTAYEPPPPCTVGLADGRTTGLTAEQAKAVTAAAAGAVRRDGTAADIRAAASSALAGHPDAAAVGRAVHSPARLTCSYARRERPAQRIGPSGLTPRAAALREAFTEAFGVRPLGGFAAGGVASGHVEDSSHYDGRAIDIFLRPLSAGNRREGWVLAHWLVAHADRHAVLSVIWQDRIWTTWASSAGWRDYTHPSGNTTNAVLRHLDHIHVAVERGPRRRATDPPAGGPPAGSAH